MVNHKKLTRFIIILVLLLSIGLVVSCSDEAGKADTVRSYIGHHVLIPADENSNIYLKNVISYEGMYYVFVENFPTDGSRGVNKLLKYSSSGELLSEQLLPEEYNADYASDIGNNFIYGKSFDEKIIVISLDDCLIVSTIDCPSDSYFVQCFEDGYYLLRRGSIDKYDYDDNLIGHIECDDFYYYCGEQPCFNQNGIEYVAAYTGKGDTYYRLNFDNSQAEYCFNLHDAGINAYGYAEYLIDSNYEYVIDMSNSELRPLYAWNYSDIIPPTRGTDSELNYFFDESSFARGYRYSDCIDLTFYSYDESIDMTTRQPIVIGGYGVNNDIALLNAVYKYNTSQDQYRAVVEDYTYNFGYDDVYEAQAVNAELISYFESGHAPDIFYGNSFDYSYFGRNGMTMDLSPYLEESGILYADIQDNIRETMFSDDGKCYSVYAAYHISGYIGLEDEVGDELSYSELANYKNSSISPFDIMPSQDLAECFIGRAIEENGSYDPSLVDDVLDFCYQYGLEADSPYRYYSSVMDVDDRDYLLTYAFIYDVESVAEYTRLSDNRLSFVGYPTIAGSLHTATPYGQVAISSGSQYLDEDLKILSYILQPDVQCLLVDNYYIPVNESAVEYLVSKSNDVTPEEISTFYEWISLIDSIRKINDSVTAIIFEEVESYYINGKSVDQVSESLKSRLDVYINEYYG